LIVLLLIPTFWISFLITKDFRKLDVKIKPGKVKIHFINLAAIQKATLTGCFF